MKLIGDKSKFAIEIFEVSGRFAKFIMWMDGTPCGSRDDSTLLSVYVNCLNTLISRPRFDDKYFNYTSGLFELLLSGDNYDPALGDFGENFEDYLMLIYFHDDTFRFYVKMVDNPYWTYSDEFPREFTALIKRSDMESVLDQLKKYLEK
jgi:hypothetical protein